MRVDADLYGRRHKGLSTMFECLAHGHLSTQTHTGRLQAKGPLRLIGLKGFLQLAVSKVPKSSASGFAAGKPGWRGIRAAAWLSGGVVLCRSPAEVCVIHTQSEQAHQVLAEKALHSRGPACTLCGLTQA